MNLDELLDGRQVFGAPRPGPPRVCAPPRDALRARVVAVTPYPEGRWRFMARAALAIPGRGVYEAEAIAPFEVWPGQRVAMHSGGIDVADAGRVTTVSALRWAHGPYELVSPMIDDSDFPQEARDWFVEVAEQLGVALRIERATDEIGTSVWKLHLDAGRGESTHIKMPGETWREVAVALGLGLPRRLW